MEYWLGSRDTLESGDDGALAGYPLLRAGRHSGGDDEQLRGDVP
jgi:hypothetical protein